MYVEFLIAFLPIFVMFLCLSQIFLLQSAQLMTEHAANQAARAAVVVLQDDPRYYAQSGPGGSPRVAQLSTIQRAAALSVGQFAVPGTNSTVAVDIKSAKRRRGFSSSSRTIGPSDPLEVTVRYEYSCGIPIANRIACDPTTQTLTLTASAILSNQGAKYEYGGPTH